MATQVKARPLSGGGPQYMTKAEAGLVREKKTTIVERELKKLCDEHGSVSAASVLEVARDKTHPLHVHFEWDDGIAAEKYRLAQATQMILATKMLVVLNEHRNGLPEVIAARPAEVRALVPAYRKEGFRFRKDVLNSVDERAAFIDRKKEALRAWCRSVIDVSELQPTVTAIYEMIGEKP